MSVPAIETPKDASEANEKFLFETHAALNNEVFKNLFEWKDGVSCN